MRQPITLRNDPEQKILDDLVNAILPQLMKSPQLAAAVHELSAHLTAEIGSRRLQDIISAHDIAERVHDNLLPLLGKPEPRTVVSRLLKQWIDEQLTANRMLGDYVPADARHALIGSLQGNMPTITNMIGEMLKRPAVRNEMIKIGRALVQDTVANQGFLSRSVIQMSGKEREFIEQVPQIVDSVLSQAESALNGRNIQSQLSNTAQAFIEQALQSKVNDVFGSRKAELYQIVDRLVNGSFDRIGAIPVTTVREITSHLYAEYGDYTLTELAERSAGLSQTQVAYAIAGTAVQYLHSDDAPAQMADLVRSGLTSDRPVVLQDFVALNGDMEHRIDNYLTERLLAFLHDQVPTIADILDVEKLVTERINEFPAEKVEGVILEVTGRHLKWINCFGAGLGAIIGLIQVVVNLIT